VYIQNHKMSINQSKHRTDTLTVAEQIKPHPQHTPRIQADKVYPNQTSEQQRHDNKGGQGQFLSHTSYKTIRIQDTEFFLLEKQLPNDHHRPNQSLRSPN
jgi:hypothetical protein